MTLVVNPSLGEYYGVQGTTWMDPPILGKPTRTEIVNGKRLLEFYNSGKLSLVAWKTSGAAYWGVKHADRRPPGRTAPGHCRLAAACLVIRPLILRACSSDSPPPRSPPPR